MAVCCSPFQDACLNYAVLFDHKQEKEPYFELEVPRD